MLIRGYFRLKPSPTSGCCPQWLIFFKNLFYQNNCKDAMNIGGGKIRGALFNFFVVKKCPFCIFRTLPSVSKLTPTYPFSLSQTLPVTLKIQFSGWTVLPDSKESKLGSSNHAASPSAVKNTGLVLVSCCAWKCVPKAISIVMWIFLRSVDAIWYNSWVLCEDQKIISRIGFLWIHNLPSPLPIFFNSMK